MKRRWLFAIFAAPLLALPAAIFVWLVYPTPRIDEDAFDQIKIGMSHDQVKKITRVPPGNYYRADRDELRLKIYMIPFKSKGMSQQATVKDWRSKNRQPKTGGVDEWWGNEYLIEVTMDEGDNVVGAYLYFLAPSGSPNLLERMGKWLGL